MKTKADAAQAEESANFKAAIEKAEVLAREVKNASFI